MKRIVSVVIAMLVASVAWAQVGISSTGTLDSRIAVAVPAFCTAPGQEAMGQHLAAVLSYDLGFTGLFTLLTPQEYPQTFTGFTRDASRIDFSAWRNTKAEFLIHAYAASTAQGMTIECRLFDVKEGQQVVGKQLGVRDSKQQRYAAHLFADEVVRFLTGTAGIATSQICFSGGVPGTKELYVADYDGANAKAITKHNNISILPTFSPDGRKVAYLSYKDGYPFLYILSLDNGQSRALSRDVGLNVAPAWAPDGTKLAYVQSKDGNGEIYLINADGSGKKRLTNNKVIDTSPSFHPDGSRIAFVSERTGAAQIFVMNTQGGDAKRLSYQGGRSYDPVWSPDGKSVAYIVEKSGEGLEVYVMDADGRNARRLTNSSGSNESPCWSADSRHVMFSSTRTGRWELWAVTVETGMEHRIPVSGLACQGPSWGPRR